VAKKKKKKKTKKKKKKTTTILVVFRLMLLFRPCLPCIRGETCSAFASCIGRPPPSGLLLGRWM